MINTVLLVFHTIERAQGGREQKRSALIQSNPDAKKPMPILVNFVLK